DAGGFPAFSLVRSKRPETLVRDLTFRVKLKGTDVPAAAGKISVGYSLPGGIAVIDPLGTEVKPLLEAEAEIPPGTYDGQWVEVKLAGAGWTAKAQEAAAKDAKEQAALAAEGVPLPGTVGVAIHYQGKTGRVEAVDAVLTSGPPAGGNAAGTS